MDRSTEEVRNTAQIIEIKRVMSKIAIDVNYLLYKVFK